MILTSLSLAHWRGYDEARLDFVPGLNAIVGPNGAGKTNLAEAIGYLSLARSWRTSDDFRLIEKGETEARIDARIREGERSRRIEIALSKESKKVSVNGKPVRKLSELRDVAHVITFCPEDATLFLSSPLERRSCVDVALSKEDESYFLLLQNAHRLLKERNLVLKEERLDAGLLDVLTDQLSSVEAPIIDKRRAYCERLNSVLPDILSSLRGEKTSCRLVYLPFVKEGDELKERARKAHELAYEADCLHRSTGSGVHREDYRFILDGKDIALYGSQGENRLCALSLKLAPYFLVKEEGKKPLVVLDDVLSELDPGHRKNLLRMLLGFSQAFVTATDIEVEGGSLIEVASHIARRIN
jgi:DNA replication and repair protein RecF